MVLYQSSETLTPHSVKVRQSFWFVCGGGHGKTKYNKYYIGNNNMVILY